MDRRYRRDCRAHRETYRAEGGAEKELGTERSGEPFSSRQRAAAALGVPPETVSALESVIGYDKVMEMFRMIGTKDRRG